MLLKFLIVSVYNMVTLTGQSILDELVKYLY
jgi:hypothetical protein